QVTPCTNRFSSQSCLLKSRRDEAYFEPWRRFSCGAHGRHGQRNTVDGDRTLLGNVPCQRRRDAKPQTIPVAQRLPFKQITHAVNMSLDHMAVQAPASRDAALK